MNIDNYDYKEFSQIEDSKGVNRVDKALELFKEVEQQKQIATPENINDDANTKLRNYFKRLWMLGYAPYIKDFDDNISFKHIKASETIVAFKKEIQYKNKDNTDNTFDDDLWHRVNEFTCFERDKIWSIEEITKLLDRGQNINSFKMIMYRAWCLRLYILGLIDTPPNSLVGQENNPVSSQLTQLAKNGDENFQIFCNKVIAPFLSKEIKSHQERIQILFDHDLLIKAVANLKPEAFKDLIKPSNNNTNYRVLLNIANVELWLAGFDGVSLNTPLQDIKGLRAGLITFWKTVVEAITKTPNHKLKTLLQEEFSEQFKVIKEELNKKEGDINLSLLFNQLFFKILDSLSETPIADEEKDETIVDDIYKPLLIGKKETELSTDDIKNTEKKVSKLWEEKKSFTARIWDGIKRLGRFIKNGFVSLINNAINQVRAFFRYVAKSFKIFKETLCIISNGIKKFFSLNNAYIYEANKIKILKDSDRDYIVYAAQSTSIQEFDVAQKHLEKETLLLSIASKVVSLFFTTITTMFGGLLGFIRLLMVLLKEYKEIRLLYEEIKKVKEINQSFCA